MTEAKDLFENLLGLTGGGGVGGGGGKTREQIVAEILERLSSMLPEDFNMFDLKMAIGENITPYLVVLIQVLHTGSTDANKCDDGILELCVSFMSVEE
jgi:hypothetical protein